ncbi:TonB-dependent receptor [Polluticoccus soli]|uniref:TonB-dependent receptor n=1 Tax=Polluticoccus soli TaxID=3034150 RepID=UPI0023E2C947|nr:TonB-dependent receptor [Flavipsychrobacter sp. JY13-12]
MNKHLLFFLLFISLSMPAFAAKVSGVVTDASTGEPLQGVLVVIKELNRPVETDDSGRYEIDNVPGGTYEVLFNFLTYKQMLQTVSIINNKDVVLNIKLKPEGNTLKDVTVKAARTTNTENAVLMEIKKSSLVVSGISAAQIQKTADRNAADVVKRIPGVTVIDNRFIMVRGLIDRYNSVWLNDAGAPSAEVDKKSFSFDLVPASFIDRIMIYKTPAPELPGDFAGGMVKLYTSSLPDKNEVSGGFDVSYRSNSTGKPFYYNTPSSTDWLGYDDGKRQLPDGTPAYINKNDSNSKEVTRAFSKNGWDINKKTTPADYRFNLNVGNVFSLGKVRLGNRLGVSYSNIHADTMIHRQSWDSTETLDFDYMDYRSVNNVSVSLMDNVLAVFGNSKIEFKNLYNQTGKSSVTMRTMSADSSYNLGDELAYQIGYDSRAVYCSQLLGSHKTRSGNTSYNWAVGYTDLFKNTPDLRRIRYTKQPSDDDTMYSAAVANTVDPVNGGGRFFAELYENVYSFNHHFTQKINLGKLNYSFEVSAGNYIEYKSRFFNARVLGYTIRSGSRAQQMNRLPLSEIFADSNLGDKTNYRIDEITAASDKYNAKNTLVASFVSAKFPIGDKITVSGGARYEDNVQELKGYINLDSVQPKIATKFLLPSVNASYNFNDKMLLRLAYGKTLNRPEFREWAPFYFYDFDSKTGVYGSLFPTIFPSDTLDVAEIDNIDARWEWYPSSGEMVHAGVFYKKFKNPIQQVILSPGIDTRSMGFMNTKEAYSAGIEIEARKDLSFVDDWFKTSFFKSFTFVGNAAFIKSEMTIDDTLTQQLAAVPLQGQSPYMYNLGMFYQSDRLGMQSSLLYNVFGPRLVSLGSQNIENIGEMPFHSLDFSLSKTFFKHYILTASAQNLLDSRSMTIQDANKDGKYTPGNTVDRDFYSFKPGRYYTVGVKVKF